MADTKARTKVVTPPFRVSFPAIFEKSSFEGSTPKHGVTMIFDMAMIDKFVGPVTKKKDYRLAYDKMVALLDEVSVGKFKKKWKDLPGNFKKGLRDGEEKAHLEGYGPGKMFAAATSLNRPGLIDRDKTPITDQELFYPGCWARATVSAYAYDNKGKGVAFGLHNVQKLGEGENFSGRVAADEEEWGDEPTSDEWGSGAAPEMDAADPLA